MGSSKYPTAPKNGSPYYTGNQAYDELSKSLAELRENTEVIPRSKYKHPRNTEHIPSNILLNKYEFVRRPHEMVARDLAILREGTEVIPDKGVPMCQLLTCSAPGIRSIVKDAEEQVLAATGLLRIQLRLAWPGCEVEWMQNIEVNTHAYGHITRAQLGSAIARLYAQYIAQLPISIRINFKNLVLLELTNVFGNVWEAKFNALAR
ncbi:hypothetical protein H0H92_005427 [Tricholoma furcatifolium]|nr:hypothetical protein H0H92_005427 [Tricholoma furcatifolium]